ncbi:MAG: hypothetical protein ACRC34_00200 [Cetobacterium sp.]
MVLLLMSAAKVVETIKDISNRIEKIVRSCENNKMPVMAKPFRWLKGVRKSKDLKYIE